MRFVCGFFLAFLGTVSIGFAQETHSHADLFAITGKIDRAEESGEIEALYALKQKILLLKNPQNMDVRYRPSENTFFKCGTPLLVEIEQAKSRGIWSDELELLFVAKTTPQPLPQIQDTFVSSSGKFEITYEKTGTNAVDPTDADTNGVPDYVEWTAFAADSSLRYMVNTLGYRNPIIAGTKYKISFKELSYYGVTYPVSTTTTRIEVHRNFVGFAKNTHPGGNQKGALYATVGHELKHAIQYMHDNWNSSSAKDAEKYLEMDATMYEDVLFDDVNDYYNYLGSSSIFGNPAASVFAADYYKTTWAFFFWEKYGPHFWRKVWDKVSSTRTTYIYNIRDAIAAEGGDMQRDIIENQLFHLVVGDTVKVPVSGRSLRRIGFQERIFYPTFSVNTIVGASNPASTTMLVNGLAARTFMYRINTTDTGKVFVRLSYTKPTCGIGIVIERKDKTTKSYLFPAKTGQDTLQAGLNERFEDISRIFGVVANTDLSTTSATGTTFQVGVSYEISNRIPITVRNEESVANAGFQLHQNYPNPFNPSTTISFSLPVAQRTRVEIFDLNGRLVAVPFNGIASAGTTNIAFDAKHLASGVYLYKISTAGKSAINRMTLIK